MGQQHPKCEWEIRLVYQNFFCKLTSSSSPTNKNIKLQRRGRFKQFCLCNHSEFGTCYCEFFFHNDRLCLPRNVHHCSWLTLYALLLILVVYCVFYLTANTIKLLIKFNVFLARHVLGTYGADGAVRRTGTSAPHTRPTQRLSRHHPSKNSVKKTICFNLYI